MILFDTPNVEVLKVMLAEWEKVGYFVRKSSDKIDKHFRGPNRAQLHILKYTVPASNNTYTIVSKKDTEGTICTWCYLKVDEWTKRKIITLRRNNTKSNDLMQSPMWILDIYTGHFLSRYKERTNSKSLDGDSLFVQFLQQNNRKGTAIPAEMVNPAVHESNQYAVVSDEGLSFIETEECTINGMLIHINENKTFVAKDNLFYKQAFQLLTTDFIVKYLRLKQAQKEGASPEEFMEIMDSGFFEPTQK